MSKFVLRVSKIYTLMETQVSERTKINFIIQRINPDYGPFLFERDFNSLTALDLK